MEEEMIVKSQAAAAAFSTMRQRRIVLALIERARSLTELSTITDTRLNLLHHHMRRLIALGLVVVEREEARAGRATKYYRAVARRFFVPSELVRAPPGDGMNTRLREALARGLACSIEGYCYASDDGRPRIKAIKQERGPASTELWLELRLSRADANALSDELRATFKRYGERSLPSQPSYIAHAAMAPT